MGLHRRRNDGGFTIIEMLVASVVLVLLVTLLASVNNHTMQLYKQTSAQGEAFQFARLAFDVMTRQLNQATLNVYWDYDDPIAPTRYVRKSDLAFVSGSTATLLGATPPSTAEQNQWPGKAVFFQAPLGRLEDSSARQLNLMLNTCGFFVKFSDTNVGAPMTRPARNRYCLMQLQTSGEAMEVFGSTTSLLPNNWFRKYAGDARILSENIALLIIRPLDDEQKDLGYTVDTRDGDKLPVQPVTSNQLPPLLNLTLLAVSEASMIRTNPADGYRLSADCLKLFSTPANYAIDLGTAEGELKDASVEYRVFSQTIALPSSRWSD